MTKEEAIEILKQIAKVIYQQGNVSLSPEAYDKFTTAIGVLETPPPPAEAANG